MLSLDGAGSLEAAYPSTAGYDEATGIGTLNVYNLITKWNTVFPSTTTLTANPTTIAANGSTTLTATVTSAVPAGSTYTPAVDGSVNFNAGSTALGSCTLSGGGCTLTVNGSALQSGRQLDYGDVRERELCDLDIQHRDGHRGSEFRRRRRSPLRSRPRRPMGWARLR